MSFHRLPGDRVTLSLVQTVPSLDILAVCFIRGPDTQALSTSISHLSPFQIPPIERERKSGTGLSKETSEIVAQLTSFFLRDTGEALDLSAQLKSP